MFFSSFLFCVFVVKVVLIVGLLGLASFFDLKERLVSNWFWVVLGSLGVCLSVVECLFGGGSLWLLFGSFVLTVVVAFAVFLFLGVGGADAKALMCVGFLFPFFPFSQYLGFVFLIFGLACFFGGVTFCGLNLVKNLLWVCRGRRLFEGEFYGVPWYWKLLACLFGQRVSLRLVDCVLYFPMQKFGRFVFVPKVGNDEDGTWLLSLENEQALLGEELFVWAQPTVPLIPFMLLSLLFVFMFVLYIFG